MTQTIDEARTEVRISGAYEIRDTLSALGGHWDAGAKEWVLTADQYDRLWAMVETSDARSNKRDRHLATVYHSDRVTVTRVAL